MLYTDRRSGNGSVKPANLLFICAVLAGGVKIPYTPAPTQFDPAR